MGGSVAVASRAGEGSKFTVRLPLPLDTGDFAAQRELAAAKEVAKW
jgi:hypothetical protein